MVQCELCGAETPSPTTVKVEGAELSVCADCASLGTEVRSASTETTTTKYSTGGTSGGDGGASSGPSAGGAGRRSRRRRDMFDQMEEIAADYDDRVRSAREAAGLAQAELADTLNEKTSLIRKIERGESLPSDTLRRKLERELGIDLLEHGGDDEDAEDADWSGGGVSGGVTLGDVVKRKK